MEINWQEVPSDTIRVTTRGAIEVAEPVAEPIDSVAPDEIIRLYVEFANSDSVTLEQQVERLSEKADLEVRRYDYTGHAAIIQTTGRYYSVILKSSDVVNVTLKVADELTGVSEQPASDEAVDSEPVDILPADPISVDTPSTDSQSTDLDATEQTAAEVDEQEPVEADSTETAESDSEETAETDSEELAADDSEELAADDSEELVADDGEELAADDSEDAAEDSTEVAGETDIQPVQTTGTLVDPIPKHTGNPGRVITVAVIGCLIIALVVALRFNRRR